MYVKKGNPEEEEEEEREIVHQLETRNRRIPTTFLRNHRHRTRPLA